MPGDERLSTAQYVSMINVFGSLYTSPIYKLKDFPQIVMIIYYYLKTLWCSVQDLLEGNSNKAIAIGTLP